MIFRFDEEKSSNYSRPGHCTARGPHPALFMSLSSPRRANHKRLASNKYLSFFTFILKFEV